MVKLNTLWSKKKVCCLLYYNYYYYYINYRFILNFLATDLADPAEG